MDFLKRNSGKIALLAIIAFFTLPFIYGNEEEDDFSPFAVKSGMSYQANPISKLANKIASFYGFSKPVSDNKDIVTTAKGTNFIKEKVADNHVFGKANSFNSKNKIRPSSKNDVLVASSRNFKNFDLGSSGVKNLNRKTYEGGNDVGSSSGSSYSGSYSSATSSPIKGYVTLNGQNYDVIEDARGERYVVTPKGHIPYKEMMKRAVSQQEFINAKKRLSNASDMEVLQTLQQEKAKYNSDFKANRQNYQSGITSYRNGTVSNMGGMNYARVSTNDKGIDDTALTDAYADLKSVKIDTPSASQRAQGGSYLRDSFRGNADNSRQNVKEESQLSPTALVAQQVKARAHQGLTAANYTNNKTAPKGEQASSEIFSVQVQDGYYKKVDNGKSFFIGVTDKDSPYGVWGEVGEKNFNDGGTQLGVIAPVSIESRREVEYFGDSDRVANSVIRINNNLETLRDIIFELGKADQMVYIDTSTMDYLSKALLNENDNFIDYIVSDPKQASIRIEGPIFTPDSFQRFTEEFQKQVELLDREEESHAI